MLEIWARHGELAFIHPTLQRFDEGRASIEECWTERWLLLGEAEQICRDPDLTVAVISGPDSDHRNVQGSTDLTGEIGGHMLQDQ